MLFWAEGSRERNTVKLTNSDPELVASFRRFLTDHFAIPPGAFAIRCNLFAEDDVERERIGCFWLSRLDLPPTCLRKSTVNVHSSYSKKKRRNKLPYGTCTLIVYNTRIVQTLYGSIQELGRFDRPAWLD